MGKSKIEWTDATWSPVTGCTPVSEGCRNCFAKRMAKRLAGRHGYPAAPNEFNVTLHEDRLEQPLHWKMPRMVFVCSMSDLFHEDVPLDYILRVWRIMHLARQHTFQVITKRPERMRLFLTEWMPGAWELAFFERPPGLFSNLWLGVSAENQEQADKRIPLLLETPAAVRFVSAEPLLGPIELRPYLGMYLEAETVFLCTQPRPHKRLRIPRKGRGWVKHDGTNHLDWAIVGGESGPGARPMHPGWARDIRDQCREALPPYFFKQWGAWAPVDVLGAEWYDKAPSARLPRTVVSKHGPLGISDQLMYRVGKRRAGRLLE